MDRSSLALRWFVVIYLVWNHTIIGLWFPYFLHTETSVYVMVSLWVGIKYTQFSVLEKKTKGRFNSTLSCVNGPLPVFAQRCLGRLIIEGKGWCLAALILSRRKCVLSSLSSFFSPILSVLTPPFFSLALHPVSGHTPCLKTGDLVSGSCHSENNGEKIHCEHTECVFVCARDGFHLVLLSRGALVWFLRRLANDYASLCSVCRPEL